MIVIPKKSRGRQSARSEEEFNRSLDKYLNYDGIKQYEADVEQAQQEVKELVIELMKAA